jgi:DUF1365 family protein
MPGIDHIRGQTVHSRKGDLTNVFRYGVDYLLLEPEADAPRPWLFSRNRGNLTSLWDSDHGGPPKQGRGAAWLREVLRDHAPDLAGARVSLLTQPRVLGHVFNPVSFWLVHDGDDLRLVVAEVTNTFGDRHSYLCHRDGFAPIRPGDEVTAKKMMHVSPFQPVEGDYRFRFDIRPDRIAIRIDYLKGNGGLVATLTGPRQPLTSGSILGAAWRRPFGSRRVLALIHWQALKLWWKGAKYRNRPAPPEREVSGKG